MNVLQPSFFRGILAVIVLSLFGGVISGNSFAQSSAEHSDIPREISYQGVLNQSGTPISDGSYSITVRFYSDESGSVKIWEDTYNTNVTQGNFSLMLGSGTAPLPSAQAMNRPLWLGIQVNGSAELRPLTPLSTTPYALNVADNSISAAKIQNGAITADKLSFDYISSVRVNGRKTAADTRTLNLKSGDGLKLEYDSATHSISFGLTDYQNPLDRNGNTGIGNMKLLSATNSWSSRGDLTNGTTTFAAIDSDWLGTSSTGTHLELRAGESGRVMAYFPNSTSPNLVGGYHTNQIVSSHGSVIAGGGGSSAANTIESNYGFLGGGSKNTIAASSDFSVLVGGENNNIYGISGHNFLGGGINNQIIQSGDGDSADYSVLVGGVGNTVSDRWSFIGGGESNSAREEHSIVVGGYANTTNAHDAAIVGGAENRIVDGHTSGEEGGHAAFIGAGYRNVIVDTAHPSVVIGTASFIGAGQDNRINAVNAGIVGGNHNLIQEYTDGSFIGAGNGNQIFTPSYMSNAWNSFIGSGTSNSILASDAALGGGQENTIDSGATYSFIGSGRWNYIQGPWSAIAGGESNRIQNDSADHNFIGGGLNNIEDNPSFGVIAGGWNNYLDANSWGSTIAGGVDNTIRSYKATIRGGGKNLINQYNEYSTIAGGDSNAIWASYSCIGGGKANWTHAPFASILGGLQNSNESVTGFIGGGVLNRINYRADSSCIVGGASNLIDFGTLAFVGGGCYNFIASSYWGIIVGGCSNQVFDSLSFIGGGDHNTIHAPHGVVGGGNSNVISNLGGNGTKAENGGVGLTALDYQTVVGRYNDTIAFNRALQNLGDPLTGTPDRVTGGALINAETLLDPNAPIFIVGNGGYGLSHGNIVLNRSNAFYVSDDGHSVNYHKLLSPGSSTIIGATYQNNTIEAWGDVPAGPPPGPGVLVAPTSGIGILQIAHTVPGTYVITLKTQGPDLLPVALSAGSVTVTVEDAGPDAPVCAFATASKISAGSFTVHIHKGDGTCGLEDHAFFFKVCGQ